LSETFHIFLGVQYQSVWMSTFEGTILTIILATRYYILLLIKTSSLLIFYGISHYIFLQCDYKDAWIYYLMVLCLIMFLVLYVNVLYWLIFQTLTYDLIQAVYNANKFAKLVKRKKKLKNWLDYYCLKFERNPDKRPTIKVKSISTLSSFEKWDYIQLIFILINTYVTVP